MSNFNNQRRDPRVSVEMPVSISIGSQLTIQGVLKDLSVQSAFIRTRNSIYLQPNDEVGFAVFRTSVDEKPLIRGLAYVSRIAVGEGFAIYFTKVDDASLRCLKDLLRDNTPGDHRAQR